VDTGVYAIINTETNTVYIGSTAEGFTERWAQHQIDLRGGYHCNQHLQAAWNKYGENHFSFMILDTLENSDEIISQEQLRLDQMRLTTDVYNFALYVDDSPMLGRHHSAGAKRKMSLAKRGENNPNKNGLSDTHKEAIKKALEGRDTAKLTEKGKQALRERWLGENNPNYAKHEDHPFYGKELTSEHKEAIRKAQARGYPAFENVETGEVIPAGYNLRKLCRERDLHPSNMCAVANGRRKTHKGWKLLEV